MSISPAELQGLKDTEALLIEKLNYFRKELVMLSGGSRKFSITKGIEALEKELKTLRLKMKQHASTNNSDVKTKSDSYVFLNYAREDTEASAKIYKYLTDNGVNVWYDKKSIKVGQNWKLAIKKGIKEAKCFILLSSSKSVQKTGYVNAEIRLAIEQARYKPKDGIYILILRLDKCQSTFDELEETQWLDLFPDFEDGLKELLEALK